MKSKKSRAMSQSTPNPSLPNDLLVSCLARVSRLYYPTLSLVSKSFRSLLASPELHQTRSALGRTESCLYVCLQRFRDPNSRWFTLCRKPDDTITESRGYVLSALPFQNFPRWSRLVALGSNIYKFGGPANEASSSVSILECRSNTWHEAPSMQMERIRPAISVFDGKIYVAGGCIECDSTKWMEVFDQETRAWEFVSGLNAEMLEFTYVEKSLVFDGKIYNSNGLAYNPKEGKWERHMPLPLPWEWFSYCVIENVFYYSSHGAETIKWLDTKVRSWKHVRGVKEGLPKVSDYPCIILADYGGKMVVLWERCLEEEYSACGGDMNIMCTVIALERRENEEIWGKVEWHGAVHTDPHSSSLTHALTATV